MDEPVVFSTENQSPYRGSLKRLIVPIISIDHLSQHYQDLPVDDILALGDQTVLRALMREFRLEGMGNELLSLSITEPEVFGPPVNYLYSMLDTLKDRCSKKHPCEVLLYLSGHGMDPGNICLVPDAMRPHPTRPTRPEHDLREIDPKNWYKYPTIVSEEVNKRPPDDPMAQHAEEYLDTFYLACSDAIGSKMVPLGFVGGEVYAHHRGFIGVLGVLGLWCYAHRECKDDTYSHLVILADCCFAGIWGNTLVRIMKSEFPEEYRTLLQKYPVSIQCATNECEASHGGVFTPLWYFLQTAKKEELDRYHSDFLKERELVSDYDMETQHPLYVSTSRWCPTWKCFDDPDFFVYLYGKQCKQLKDDLQRGDVAEDNCSPLVRPYIKALNSEVKELRKQLKEQLRKAAILARHPVQSQESLNISVDESIITIQQSLADIRDLLFKDAPRSRVLRPFVLVRDPKDGRDKLKDTVVKNMLKKLDHHPPVEDISPGVYVFQGGVGDMSLIVTPEQEQVILIDGASNAECFIAAWNSTLRHLKRITHIFVTHHDQDHTYGIQLLLSRYWWERLDTPDIRRTIIYMNTRVDFILRNFKNEKEIETLAKSLGVQVKHLIIEEGYPELHRQGRFFLTALLPRQQLVDKVREKVPEHGDLTKDVSSRGDTTAANVLSINLVAVWKERDAYLFTGDAHLKDVTEAAQHFLRIHRVDSFKYVDVPHHGSANSNVKNVDARHLGLAGIPASNYLISHHGNHQNPSMTTVTHILRSQSSQKLHFLYPTRKSARRCKCAVCDKQLVTNMWHCECVAHYQNKIDTALHPNGPFKFFPFE